MMTPKCCEHCHRFSARECTRQNYYKKCADWRVWFRKHWAGIRRAARDIAKEREAPKQ
jgi:hypothetical protein